MFINHAIMTTVFEGEHGRRLSHESATPLLLDYWIQDIMLGKVQGKRRRGGQNDWMNRFKFQ